jgi:hypothetical protein
MSVMSFQDLCTKQLVYTTFNVFSIEINKHLEDCMDISVSNAIGGE